MAGIGQLGRRRKTRMMPVGVGVQKMKSFMAKMTSKCEHIKRKYRSRTNRLASSLKSSRHSCNSVYCTVRKFIRTPSQISLSFRWSVSDESDCEQPGLT